jgi:hypothetical protein
MAASPPVSAIPKPIVIGSAAQVPSPRKELQSAGRESALTDRSRASEPTFPGFPGWLGVMFRFIGVARNEIGSQPRSFAAKSGCSARDPATHRFAFIEAFMEAFQPNR